MLSEDHVVELVECATHQLRRIGAFVRRYVSSIVKGTNKKRKQKSGQTKKKIQVSIAGNSEDNDEKV
jgi:hypothetical protein